MARSTLEELCLSVAGSYPMQTLWDIPEALQELKTTPHQAAPQSITRTRLTHLYMCIQP